MQKFSTFRALEENSLYTTPADKDTLTKSKENVAVAFLYNFFGMLGLINGVQPAHRTTLLNSFKKDKKLQVSSIDDTNLDISLSVKLAHDADFFISPTTVNEITRFLVKLKAGQVDMIDSAVVAKWANAVKPDFQNHITDPLLRQAWVAYRVDEGKTLDSSWLAVVLKRRMTRNNYTGDFGRYAKRFFGLAQIPVTSTIAATPTPAPTAFAVPAASATPATPPPNAPAVQKLNYYQRQKLAKAAAAAGNGTPPPTRSRAPAGQHPEIAGMSYYTKNKLKANAAAVGMTLSDFLYKRDADKAAAAEAEAARLAELRAKADEAAARVKELAKSGVPAELINDLFNMLFYGFNTYDLKRKYRQLANLPANSDIPDNVSKLIEAGANVANAFNYSSGIRLPDNPAFPEMIKAMNTFATELSVGVEDLMMRLIELPTLQGNTRRSTLMTSFWAADKLVDDIMFKRFVKMHPLEARQSIRHFLDVYDYRDKWAKYLKIISEVVTKEQFLELLGEGHIRLEPHNVDYTGKSFEFPARRAMFWTAVVEYFGISADDLFFSEHTKSRAFEWGGLMVLMCGNPSWSIKIQDGGLFSESKVLATFAEFARDKVVTWIESNPENAFRLTQKTSASLVYDPAKLPHQQPAQDSLHRAFAKHIEENGLAAAQFMDAFQYYDSAKTRWFALIGVDMDKVLARSPADFKTIEHVAKQDFLKLSDDQIQLLLMTNPTNPNQVMTGNNVAYRLQTVLRDGKGPADDVRARVFRVLTKIYRTAGPEHKMQDAPQLGRLTMDHLAHLPKDVMLDFLRAAMEKKDKYIMTATLYKNLYKNDKSTYVDALTGIMQDAIGTDVEDYIEEIMETMPQHVLTKMRGQLVGASVLVDDIQKGDIKPFATIDANRMKQILTYNNLNLSTLIPNLGKKKKGEKYVAFFARAKAQAHGAALDPLKVEAPAADKASAQAATKSLLAHHAGRHGDVYPLVNKVFKVNMVNPEFDQFASSNPRDGSIAPAFHGTGGIAAAMILRYGFKVIPSTDSSTAGRMLGNGIYFSNKIDKSMQYVSNGGYGRNHGDKGYVLEMDSNLGREDVHYKKAGVQGTQMNIRSPEWCVFDAKAQLRIHTAYEVTLASNRSVTSFLAEDANQSFKRFSTFLKEETQRVFNTTIFLFRDGTIPIVKDDGSVDYVDFEDALAKKLITPDMFDTSSDGPLIVFDDTEAQVQFDFRSARQMVGDDMLEYAELFRKKMLTTSA